MRYEHAFGISADNASQADFSAEISGTFKSKTIMVMMIAITPSLKDSIRLVGINFTVVVALFVNQRSK